MGENRSNYSHTSKVRGAWRTNICERRCGSCCGDGCEVDSTEHDGLIVNVTDLNILRNCRGYAVDLYTNMFFGFSGFDSNGSSKVVCF